MRPHVLFAFVSLCAACSPTAPGIRTDSGALFDSGPAPDSRVVQDSAFPQVDAGPGVDAMVVPYSQIVLVDPPTAAITQMNGELWTVPDYETYASAAARDVLAGLADEYDFLAIYSEQRLQIVDAEGAFEVSAVAVGYQQNIGGLGPESGSGSPPASAGSAGRLLQVNLMGDVAQWAPGPSQASILVHETTHRWAVFAEVRGGAPAQLLESSFGAHWNVHANTGGPSAVGYGDLFDLGGGRFRFEVIYPLSMSPLEMYLAGIIPASEVPPMFYVTNANSYDPATPEFEPAWTPQTYGEDATFSGERVNFTVEDIIAANGARTPAFGTARTDFHCGFALVCAVAGACSEESLAIVEAQRVAFPAAFAAATGNRASMNTDL